MVRIRYISRKMRGRSINMIVSMISISGLFRSMGPTGASAGWCLCFRKRRCRVRPAPPHVFFVSFPLTGEQGRIRFLEFSTVILFVVVALVSRGIIERNLCCFLLFVSVIGWCRSKLRIFAMLRGRGLGWRREFNGRNVDTAVFVSVDVNDSLRRTVGRIFELCSTIIFHVHVLSRFK